MDNVEDVYALAPIQQGLLYHSIQSPESGVFVDQVSYTLSGALDITGFQQAWDQVVARHSALRTCFLWDGLDDPLQVVRGQVELNWLLEDWRTLNPVDRERSWCSLVAKDRQRGLDLAAAPLLRMHLVQTRESEWRWLWSFHHLVCDGWSSAILLREVFSIYRALCTQTMPTLDRPFHYRDFIAWHAARDHSAAEAFWRTELAGLDGPSRLPLPDGPGPAKGSEHRQQSYALSNELGSALAALATDCRVTPNTLAQAAWALLLSKYAHSDEVLFGVTLSGRSLDIPGIEGGVGLFINTLPMRLRIDSHRPLREWLQALQQKHFELLDWESTPLSEVQKWSGIAPGEPMFESILVFENYPTSAGFGDDLGLQVSEPQIVEHSNYPLALLIVPGAAPRCFAVYDTGRLDDGQIERLLEQFATLLESFTQTPDQALGDFALSNDSAGLPPAADLSTASTAADPVSPMLVQRIEEAIATDPDAIAIRTERKSLSYRALDWDASRIAHGLTDRGIGTGSLVGIYAKRDPAMIGALLGVQRAGAAYVPLDQRYPADQIRWVADDANLAAVIAPQCLIEAMPALDTPVIAIETLCAPTDGEATTHSAAPGAGDLAYVIFTSGSTGRPKGVEVTHGNLARSTAARIDYYREPPARFLLLSSFAFDSSVAGIFWTLGSGGTLVLPEDGLEQDMARLSALIADCDVTHLLCLPTLYSLLLEHAGNNQLASLTTVIVAGEACPTTLVERHFQSLPDAGLYNEYGPTEATVWSTVHRVTPADAHGQVPIGRPLPGIELHLLDQHQRPVPVGVAGEIYLGGETLARGYLGDPELTAQRFIELDCPTGGRRHLYRTGDLAWRRDDDQLVFLGRADRQVKVRGFRVELRGIEEAIVALPEIAAAAVRLSDPQAGNQLGDRGQRLIGYLVAAPDQATNTDLEEHVHTLLTASLPDYMRPDQLISLGELPQLPNGKVDYRALPAPGDTTNRAPSRAAESAAEHTLAAIWSELLGVDAVGVDEDFFALGGDSIVSIQMISQARQAGLNIRPRDLLRKPTIAGLVSLARTEKSSSPDETAFGAAPLTPIQTWFFELGLVAPAHWNQSALFEVAPDLDANALEQAVTACWHHHDALRARFHDTANGWQQHIAAADDAPEFSRIDLATLSESEQELAIERHIAAAQAGFDLQRGSLLHAVWFMRGQDQPALLAIAVHHLVIDAVSWSILTEDLETACRQVGASEPITLPAKTTALRTWAQHLVEWASSDALRTATAYWAAPFSINGSALPADIAGTDAGSESNAKTLHVTLDTARTDALLGKANEAYQTRTEELLLAALASAYQSETGYRVLRLELESHGRSDEFDGIDVTRTVGWFTAMYPLVLDLSTGSDAAATLKSIKEQLRCVLHGGLSYGPLRYLAPTATNLRSQPVPSLLFNYLGRIKPRNKAGPLHRISSIQESARDPRNARSHQLQINTAVVDGRLDIALSFSSTCHRAETIEHFSWALIAALRALLDHCALPTSGGRTPSDFSEADLSQDELDRFLDGLE